MSEISIKLANLQDDYELEASLDLINQYALDPMGDGAPLDDEVRARLGPGLRDHPTSLVFLAKVANQHVGIAVCFLGFSTFKARPLINIHDIYVAPEARGQKLASRLFQAVEDHARSIGCCKLTLEILEGNTHAYQVYQRLGFGEAFYNGQSAGKTLFLTKHLM